MHEDGAAEDDVVGPPGLRPVAEGQLFLQPEAVTEHSSGGDLSFRGAGDRRFGEVKYLRGWPVGGVDRHEDASAVRVGARLVGLPVILLVGLFDDGLDGIAVTSARAPQHFQQGGGLRDTQPLRCEEEHQHGDEAGQRQPQRTQQEARVALEPPRDRPGQRASRHGGNQQSSEVLQGLPAG